MTVVASLFPLAMVGLLSLVGCASGGEPPPVPPPQAQGPALVLADDRGSTAPVAGSATEFGATPHQLVMADQTVLPLRRWGPVGEAPSAVVLGLHGFNDHGGALVASAAALVPEGVAVYAWDQRGFGATAMRGRWPGTELLVDDAVTVAQLLRKRYPDTPLYLLGLSMGGAITTLVLEHPGLPAVDGAVLVAPAFWGWETMPWYQRSALWLSRWLMPWASFTGEGLDIQPTDDPEVGRQLAADPLWLAATRVDALYGVTELMGTALQAVPRIQWPQTLVLYGGEDDIVPPSATCALFQRLPEGSPWRAAYYPEGYHMLTRYSGAQAVLADINAFIKEPEASLPSGLEVSRQAMLAATCEE